MKHPEDDVHLTNGDGFMVAEGRYKEHLKVATEIKEVCAFMIGITGHLILNLPLETDLP